MRKMLRARNVFLLSLLSLPLLIFAWLGHFTYRLNNVCGPGEHLIQSEDDAIETAKARALQARFGSVEGFTEKPSFVDFSHLENCCTAARIRTIFGVIVWEVYLNGHASGESSNWRVRAHLPLSNCGALFVDESFLLVDPS